MKKIALCALISLLAGCALPRHVAKPDPNFTYNPELRVRVGCDTGSGGGAGKVQIATFIETSAANEMEVTLNNFWLKDSKGKEFPATAWRVSPMEDLNLSLKAYNLSPTTPKADEATAKLDAHHAALFILEFTRPSEKEFLFQFTDSAKTPLFSAKCTPPEDQVMKALKEVDIKKKR
ncbi:MAG: hypothetical protein V4736_05475 [Bdellovibrionota bacterium]